MHTTTTDIAAVAERVAQGRTRLLTEIRKVIVGQDEVIDQVLIALFTGGHCLITGVPGLAKTLLIKTVAQILDLSFKRIQFTPDLMPADITGTEVLDEAGGHRSLRFVKGPIFAHILLADEINRTPPKTQSALLEAMQERTISYAGTTHLLPRPFFVLATQNPLEQAGTYPLPEAQLDRFLLHVRVDYPDEADERTIIALQALTREVHVGDELLAWITRLVRATRPQASDVKEVRDWVRWGAGPRAGQSLVLASKARALLRGRLAATRDDVAALAAPVLRHRLLLSFAAEAEQRSSDDVVVALLHALPAP
jgi:MoxR-like ATPase